MLSSANQRRNKLLAHMPQIAADALCPHLEPIDLKYRQRLEQPNRDIPTAVFVEEGLVSVVATNSSGRRQAEVAIVGNEGMTGLALLLGGKRADHDIFVQVAGCGHSISGDALDRSMRACPELTAWLLRYAHLYTLQLAHTALANAQGSIEERLARWLLMANDRIGGDEVALTHDLLALMLGVRRAGVTVALHHLESEGHVALFRGLVRIVNRRGLEGAAGGFYGAPERAYARFATGASFDAAGDH
jgi:CRP-like cAMP-binding protein